MTERLHFHFSLSCIEGGNGNPLQCSCLENPRDSGAWWAAVYGVAQSRTRLKRLSSSSSSIRIIRGYYGQLYGNKIDNLEEMDRFLEKFNLLRLNQEEIEIMNNPITNTEIEALIKNIHKY